MQVRTLRFRPSVELLEDRVVPYALSGSRWASPAVSASFMPDGTITDTGSPSRLFATLIAIAPTDTWQREFARALQTWADVTNLNFHLVPDSGAASGVVGNSQNDSRFGDIRLGAYTRSDAYLAYTYYPSGSTQGGDEFLDTGIDFHIGSPIDLYSTFLHETGHALGLAHSTSGTVMYPQIMGVYGGLTADDIAGIRALYGARRPDSFDARSPNDNFAAASALTLSKGAVSFRADLTSLADVDYYRLVAPAGDGTLTVSVNARNRSLLTGRVSVYDAAFHLLGSADAPGYGGRARLTLSGLTAGNTYYVVADGVTGDAFGMGAYKLSAQFGGSTTVPSVSIGDVSLAEGNSGTTQFSFSVTLSAPSTSTVTVQYSTSDGTAVAGSDYTAVSGTVTFAPGETQKTVEVSVTGDTTLESDETFFVNLTSPADVALGDGRGRGTIGNDEPGPDRLEFNNTVITARDFGAVNNVSRTGLTLHKATDRDFYSFVPTRWGTFQVVINPSQAAGTLDLELRKPSQAVLASGQSETGAVALDVTLVPFKRYYLRVTSATGSLVGYSLVVSRQSGGGAMRGSLPPDDPTPPTRNMTNDQDDANETGRNRIVVTDSQPSDRSRAHQPLDITPAVPWYLPPLNEPLSASEPPDGTHVIGVK